VKIPIFMIFKFVMVVATWANKALEDGKITASEGLELIAELAAIIGVPLELDVSKEVTEVIENITGAPLEKESAALLSKPDFKSPGD